MFSNYKNLIDLDNAYESEKKKLDDELQRLNELRYQVRKDNNQSYDLFLYLKNKMDYSDEALSKTINILEEYEDEAKKYIRQQEMKLESNKETIKKAYSKQYEKIEEMD
ncbi:hypothetical protein ABH521_006760 [Staphylococcus warneri]|uniref:hypothetical protein n=1 Tax=Staphylococcus warneri TaxID=1292 RepID=UPI0032611AB2